MFKRMLTTAGHYLLRAAGVNLNWQTLLDCYSGSKTSTGITVTEDVAYRNSAMFSGIVFLSEIIASLPFDVYTLVDEDSRKKDRKHHLTKLLRRRANPKMSAMTCFETMQAHALGWGHGYAEIEWTREPKPIALHPIHPSYVRQIDELDAYQVTIPGESKPEVVPGWRMLHLRAPLCYGLIDRGRESISISSAMEQFTGLFFGNNASLGTILERDNMCRMNDIQADAFMKSLNARHGGLSNAHRTILLPNGVKANMLAMAPELAQLLQTRRFQVEEIARFLRMPVHLLRETSHGVSYASIEVQSTEFLLYTLRPWLTRWEAELNYKLLSEDEQEESFIEINTKALLRADMTTRYAAYNIGRNGGWLSRNDIRKLENMEPIEGGDDYLTPLNMATVGRRREADEQAARLAKLMRAIIKLEKSKKSAA